jgi:hypothetical protein
MWEWELKRGGIQSTEAINGERLRGQGAMLKIPPGGGRGGGVVPRREGPGGSAAVSR